MMPRQNCPLCQNTPRLSVERALRAEVSVLRRAVAEARDDRDAALKRVETMQGLLREAVLWVPTEKTGLHGRITAALEDTKPGDT